MKRLFFNRVTSQEIHTAKNVQARPPKNGAIGAKGPLNWASAKPIHGNPVKMMPRRYSATTQLAARSKPKKNEFLEKWHANVAQAK